MKKTTLLAALALLTAGVARADVVLLDNDFGAGADIGPSFVERQAGTTGGSTDPDTGYYITGQRNNSLYGLESSAGVDITSVSGATGFTIDWTVLTSTANPAYNGLQFHLLDSAGAGIGIALLSPAKGDMQFLTNGVTTVSLGAAAPTADSLLDGYTISLTVNNDDTWSASSTGLSSDFSTGGTLEGTLSFASMSTDVIASSFYQGYTQSTTLDHVTVTAIPEPGTLGLIAAFGGGILLIRRRFMI